jgi:hypothetical protein
MKSGNSYHIDQKTVNPDLFSFGAPAVTPVSYLAE